jgi:hypothetical protein
MLPRDWSGQTLLELACRTRFGWQRGYRIIAETVLPKPFAAAIEGLAWVFSSRARKPGAGLALVLLVWTNGTRRLPLGRRLWRQGGASKYALALALRSDARHRLRCRPEDGLLDAWHPSRALLKRIRDYGWDVVCRLKKHRRFDGQALRPHRRHPYGVEIGWLSGGLNGLVGRSGKKYDATNRLTLAAARKARPLEHAVGHATTLRL